MLLFAPTKGRKKEEDKGIYRLRLPANHSNQRSALSCPPLPQFLPVYRCTADQNSVCHNVVGNGVVCWLGGRQPELGSAVVFGKLAARVHTAEEGTACFRSGSRTAAGVDREARPHAERPTPLGRGERTQDGSKLAALRLAPRASLQGASACPTCPRLLSTLDTPHLLFFLSSLGPYLRVGIRLPSFYLLSFFLRERPPLP